MRQRAYEMGDLRRAHDEFEWVAAQAPEFSAVHYYRALMREGQRDPDGALEMYQIALNVDPADFRSLFNIALLFIDSKDIHPAALRALRKGGS